MIKSLAIIIVLTAVAVASGCSQNRDEHDPADSLIVDSIDTGSDTTELLEPLDPAVTGSDTVVVRDTVRRSGDTTRMRDTVRVVIRDTIRIRDTVIITKNGNGRVDTTVRAGTRRGIPSSTRR